MFVERVEPADLLRASLFKLDPERAHSLTLRLLELAGALPPLRSGLRRIFSFPDPSLAVEAFGLSFKNPVGLAAGYDKSGTAMHGLACLGFGHLELGTVTLDAQSGNPRPRVFRLVEDEALINRMGFPNGGVKQLLTRLKNRPSDVVVGVNIGRSAETPTEQATRDYVRLMEMVYLQADYLAVNISSPNTVGLRRLQGRRLLEGLLRTLANTRSELAAENHRWVPILVKLAPDLGAPELKEAIEVILESRMDGVIATNTTTARAGLNSERRSESGGLSGRPLRELSTDMIRVVHAASNGKLPVIGVGGIFGPRDAGEKLDAGASLVQVYTGLVYKGPGLVRTILSAMAEVN